MQQTVDQPRFMSQSRSFMEPDVVQSMNQTRYRSGYEDGVNMDLVFVSLMHNILLFLLKLIDLLRYQVVLKSKLRNLETYIMMIMWNRQPYHLLHLHRLYHQWVHQSFICENLFYKHFIVMYIADWCLSNK